ncbi:MAG: hypothetical protein Q9159_002423 [Coniocarpon cinnabarinum]
MLSLITACIPAAVALAQYADTLQAHDLIGDYFGLPFENATFDYVVIGGGTAGLAMANRLSANRTISVAVVEAGSWSELDNGNQTAIPGYAAVLSGTAPTLKNNRIDWDYQTINETGLGRSIFYTSGKTLGGGSARNYMVYTRQLWADQVDDQSYTFGNLLPYFQRSVTYKGSDGSKRAPNASVSAAAESFGTNGPVQVSHTNWANAFASWAQRGLAQAGFRSISDFVSGDLLGQQYAAFQLDLETQTRCSSEVAYLRPALQSPRLLTLYTSSLAERILFDDKRAAGVAVSSAGMRIVLHARREVILSAGAHRSPQLLMLSGIGPQETLKSFSIAPLADRPGVGQNLQDQPFYGISYPVDLTTHTSLTTSPDFAAQQATAYAQSRTGMLTNTGSDFLAWEKLPRDLRAALTPETQHALEALPSDWPEVLYTVVDAFSGDGRSPLTATPVDGRQYGSILLTLVAPFSRGNVTLGSNDASHNPIINSGLLSDPKDQEVAVQAFKRIRDMFNTSSIREVVTGPEVFPGAHKYEHLSETVQAQFGMQVPQTKWARQQIPLPWSILVRGYTT